MSAERTLEDRIDTAASAVGPLWPIHSFVTANPLSGFEHRPFPEAVERAADLFGGRGYPSAETFRTALERGQIDPGILEETLSAAGYAEDPEALLDRVALGDAADAANAGSEAGDSEATDRTDRVLCKWLSTFLTEGSAHWPMPDRDAGFYDAFREMSTYDAEIPDDGIVADLPETPTEAIETVMEPVPESRWVRAFEEQLAALPGWTGLIKRRAGDGPWASAHPITLTGYLAVRLAVLDGFGADLDPSEESGAAPGSDPDATPDAATEIAEAFLSAWEASYRTELVAGVAAESRSRAEREPSGRPDAQLVFCIDTRSEVIRRHIEAAGDYETHGYAGFFGVPMEYRGYGAEVSVDACPPILDPEHRIAETPTDEDVRRTHDRRFGLREAAGEAIETLKANAATAYGYIETAGSGYGLALAARTLVPGRVRDLLAAAADAVPDTHEFCEQTIDRADDGTDGLPLGLTLEQRVEYAATAFELMGIEEFGRLVVFAGHASETTNNPYGSSLDCGACAGNPGGPNARVLAAICNDGAVREELRARGIDVPGDTVFVAGQHNTTTDEIELYDGRVPESHAADLKRLRADLETARRGAASERAAEMGADAASAVRNVERRAGDWAETRPEWGLAGNAGFVVGPRELTTDLDLDGRSFLHSYDWSTDPDGDALEAILTGPMVVTQWINAQYYFSTVDNAVYGSGSKVTQNPVGNVGVYQGNGGDLMSGLPLQSLMSGADELHHQPLRLSTVVHAPLDRVTDVLAANEGVAELLDNDWLSLTVVDPTREHRAFHYDEDLRWTSEPPATAADPAAREGSAVADD